MEFGAWQYLPLLILIPILAALHGYGFRRRRKALVKFLALSLVPGLVAGAGPGRQWAKALCLIGAALFLVVALMQPQWGKRAEDTPRWGRDVIVLLDVSLSMLAEDSAPNRLGTFDCMRYFLSPRSAGINPLVVPYIDALSMQPLDFGINHI